MPAVSGQAQVAAGGEMILSEKEMRFIAKTRLEESGLSGAELEKWRFRLEAAIDRIVWLEGLAEKAKHKKCVESLVNDPGRG